MSNFWNFFVLLISIKLKLFIIEIDFSSRKCTNKHLGHIGNLQTSIKINIILNSSNKYMKPTISEHQYFILYNCIHYIHPHHCTPCLSLHTGQSDFRRSHSSIHSLWKMWSQKSFFAYSPFFNSIKQIVHLI